MISRKRTSNANIEDGYRLHGLLGGNSIAREPSAFPPATVLTVRFVSRSALNPKADLEASLAFVIGRIEEEARRSGEPPSDEERSLLNDLPTHSVVPMGNGSDPESPTVPVPRDTVFERLCALARDACNSDVRLAPTSALDWEFAAAVSKLNHHPMSWLLHWAGVKSVQTVVGSLASRSCCAGGDILGRGPTAAGGKSNLDAIPMDWLWRSIHRCLASHIFCVTTTGGMAVEAKHRKMSPLQPYPRPMTALENRTGAINRWSQSV